MSEYVELKTARKVVCSVCREFAPPGGCPEDCAWMRRLTPSLDVEDVVRCKRCYYSEQIADVLYCSYWGKNTEEDGYCHNGG